MWWELVACDFQLPLESCFTNKVTCPQSAKNPQSSLPSPCEKAKALNWVQALNTMFNVVEVLTDSEEDKEKHNKPLNTLNVLMIMEMSRLNTRWEILLLKISSFYKEKKDEQVTHHLVKLMVKTGIAAGEQRPKKQRKMWSSSFGEWHDHGFQLNRPSSPE